MVDNETPKTSIFHFSFFEKFLLLKSFSFIMTRSVIDLLLNIH